MNVERVIVHSLRKDEKVSGAAVDLSQHLLPRDPRAEELVRMLDDRYREASSMNAAFKEGSLDVFPTCFSSYRSARTDNSFIDFSQKALEDLKTRVEKIPAAKGGFLVFADYQTDWESCVAVFLIRDTNGMLFRKEPKTGSYYINPVEHLDLNRLAMACKVDLVRYGPQVTARYLSYIKRNMEVISRYFVEWIAAAGIESGSVYTSRLCRLIDEIPENRLPVVNGAPLPRAQLKESAYDFCKNAPGGIVNLNRLSDYLYRHDSEALPDAKSRRAFLPGLAQEQDITIDTEFRVDTRQLKRLVRIEVEADGITLRFSPRDKQVKVRLAGKDRVVIESEAFANKYREELGL